MKKAVARWDSRLSIGRGPRGVPASIPLSKLPFVLGTVKPISPFSWGYENGGVAGVLVPVAYADLT